MYSAKTKDYLVVKCSGPISVVKTTNAAVDNQFSYVAPSGILKFVTHPHNIFPEVSCPAFVANTTSLNGDTLSVDYLFNSYKYVY